LFDRDYYQKQKDPEKLTQLPDEEFPQPPYSYLNQYQALRQFDSSKLLHKIKAKTLVLGARNDFFATPSDLKALSDQILTAKLQIFENTGHLLSLDKPDEFSKAILSFLKE
jgi:pimeloyl-ACP methyl ester carboxylesterase